MAGLWLRHREIPGTTANTHPMERTINFSDVISYDFNVIGSDMFLELSQQDSETKIKIAIRTADKGKPISDQMKLLPAAISHNTAVTKKRNLRTKMTEEAVKEIRSNWEQVVKACGTKNAAAERLAKIYNCSSKNIYAIIYRYSWAHV